MSKITTIVDNIISKVNTNTTNIDTHISVPTSYHIYNGGVSIDNTVVTNGFATTLYTGNGSTQTVTTNVDMSTQWGNSTTETFGGLVWSKSRSGATSTYFIDTVRGVTKDIYSNATTAETTEATGLTAFNSNGFSLGALAGMNTNTATYVSWAFQTTHRKTGTTNQGKAYTEHYNPYTGFTIIKYTGSGLAGHEIPHSLNRKLAFWSIKDLTSSSYNWGSGYRENNQLKINLTDAESPLTTGVISVSDTITTLGNSTSYNTSGDEHIMYGWANSYYDKNNTLIGNYEIGTYQGTGVADNKVTTRGKPAWVMIKRLDITGNWWIVDNVRSTSDPRNETLYSNLPGVEDINSVGRAANFLSDGFSLAYAGETDANASGGQYLYMVVYDNDSGSGKSKYPKATDTTNVNINAYVPYANGIDSKGSKVSISYKNQTISGLTLTQGKNYIYSLNDNTYGVKTIAPNYGIANPLTGDFFNLKTLKWYDNTNTEITPRTYLDCIVYADQNGQPEYVEELAKTTYLTDLKVTDGFDLGQSLSSLNIISGVTYTNKSNRKIKLFLVCSSATNGSSASITVDGFILDYYRFLGTTTLTIGLYAEIPIGSTFSATLTSGVTVTYSTKLL